MSEAVAQRKFEGEGTRRRRGDSVLAYSRDEGLDGEEDAYARG